MIRELQESQVSVSDRLAQQRQRLTELCSSIYVLDPDFVSLQDTKDRVRSTYCGQITPCHVSVYQWTVLAQTLHRLSADRQISSPKKEIVIIIKCLSRLEHLHPEPSASV